jgi:hypothetical protein
MGERGESGNMKSEKKSIGRRTAIRLKKIKNAWKTFWLDLKAIPLIFLKIRGKKKEYAQKHLSQVCAHCPQHRKLTRDVNGNGTCWWYENWKQENYDIPSDFGVKNWLRFYSGADTQLEEYKTEDDE